MHVCVDTIYIPYKNYIIFNYLFNLLTKEQKNHFSKKKKSIYIHYVYKNTMHVCVHTI